VTRFDSPAVFCALLGDADDGRWKVAVVGGEVVSRRYLPSTFVLETIWQGPSGRARTADFLPPGDDWSDLVRRVECLEGTVSVEHDLRLRFDYARATPWLRRVDDTADGRPALLCIGGPDALLFTGPLLTHGRPAPEGEDLEDDEGARARRLTGTIELTAGETASWDLTWFPAWKETPEPPDPDEALGQTVDYWRDWASRDGADRSRRRRPAVPARPAGPDAPRHRRHRRGGHRVAPGRVRRQPELGLPLHLAARRRADHRGDGRPTASPGGLFTGGTGCCAPSRGTPSS
jgi:hypothetical protein